MATKVQHRVNRSFVLLEERMIASFVFAQTTLIGSCGKERNVKKNP